MMKPFELNPRVYITKCEQNRKLSSLLQHNLCHSDDK